MPLAAQAEPFFTEADPSRTDGRRVGVLLSHGFCGSPASIVPWGRHVAGHGYAVSVPRLPGHGTTWQEMNRTRWQDWYGEVERAFEKLRANCDHVVVGGLSMGGALALRLAEDHGTEVAGLVLVNPALTNDNPLQHLRHVLKLAVPSLPGIVNDIKKPGQDEHGYHRTPTRAAALRATANHGRRSQAKRITKWCLTTPSFHAAKHSAATSSIRPQRRGASM